MSRSSTMGFPIFVASANFEMKLFSPTSMPFMYIMKKTGPTTEPSGTPLVTDAQSETVPLMTTLCFLLLRQFLIQLWTFPLIPSFFDVEN